MKGLLKRIHHISGFSLDKDSLPRSVFFIIALNCLMAYGAYGNSGAGIMPETGEEIACVNPVSSGHSDGVARAYDLSVPKSEAREARRIRPWTEDRRYWQYKGKPVLLLGGTDQDNPFNHPNIGPAGLEAHLDLLVSAGGNYLRNTMSSRDRNDPESERYNDDNIYPFFRDEETGLYNLDLWNEAYWDRFHKFLEMTSQRDIIVQIEIWDRWDFGADRYPNYVAYGWSEQPFNPKNNINYTAEETSLDEEKWQGYPIFRTIPQLDNDPRVLVYQEALVEKMLSVALNYDHILYCISNETTSSEEWSRYWAEFVLKQANSYGVGIEVTEMWDNWDLNHSMHRRTFDHPDIYSYTDISQNNHQRGQTHWDNMQSARNIIGQPVRPMNNIKIYGGEHHGGGLAEGYNKFWRGILGGCASVRFHRPGRFAGYYGAGLSEQAQTQIRSARMFEKDFDIFRAQPDVNSKLLLNRQENEAYLSYIPGKQYAIFFPDGGEVGLDLKDSRGRFILKWLDISNSQWSDAQRISGGDIVEVKTPGEGQWIGVVQSRRGLFRW
jgi:hypothetical protein